MELLSDTNYLKQYANLHLHSTHSDGEYSPSELVYIAKKEGYKALALTDHDTVSGVKELISTCKKEGMECVTGVEFTCTGLGEAFHVTGLDFDIEDKNIQDYCVCMAERETFRTKTLFELGIKKGRIKNVTWEEVQQHHPGISWLCVDHVFRTLVNKGILTMYNYREFYDANFGHGPEFQFVYKEMPHRIYEVQEVIDLINNAGGVAVLAHGHNQLQCVPELVEMGLKGIEVWHDLMTPEERCEAVNLAQKYNLYISGGTDHGGKLGGLDKFDPEGKIYGKYNHLPLMYGTSEINFNALKKRIYG